MAKVSKEDQAMSDAGYQWVTTNGQNRWETKEEKDARITAKVASNKMRESEKQQELFANEIKNYKISDFNFDPSNEAMLATKQAYAQNEQDTRRDLGQAMAQRGVSDSGLANRMGARLSSQTGQNIAQAQGQEYLRQQQQWGQNESRRYGLAMDKYNVSSQLYDKAQNQFWQSLSVQTENANRAYQQQIQNEDSGWSWGKALSGAGTGALAGSTVGPWGTAVGAVAGFIGGGIS